MFKSMFAKLFSRFMAVILFALTLTSIFSYYTIRDMRVNSRMAELKKEAREIAFLASQTRFTLTDRYFNQQSPSEALLQWKANRIYDEFGAYIVVVDRRGRLMQNIKTVTQDDPDFAAALDMQEVYDMLNTAMAGKEVHIQTTWPGAGGHVFIVAVPWLQNDVVLGAVFIHTSAQVIRAEYQSLIFQVIGVIVLAALISGIIVFWYVRRITRPLTSMAAAAGKMAQGDFEVRAESSSLREVDELAQAFNLMVHKLSELEDSRREFVANVSHELRSPITSIRGYIEGLRDGTIPLSEQPHYLKIVSDETKRLTKLIADLLSLSRMEQTDAQLNLTDFDLSELIRRVLLRRMNDIDQKSIDMSVTLPDEALIVHADNDRIEQVIVNLFDNAIKFTPEQGVISVEAKSFGKEVSLIISDTGEGIPPEDREHIFERFYTANKAHTVGKGTGLGLSICRRIMEQHGKAITLLPTECGAAFEITLDKGGEIN